MTIPLDLLVPIAPMDLAITPNLYASIYNTGETHLWLNFISTAAALRGEGNIELPPGGILLWTCPTAAGIDTTTNKNLLLASKTSGTITFDIVMIGLD